MDGGMGDARAETMQQMDQGFVGGNMAGGPSPYVGGTAVGNADFTGLKPDGTAYQDKKNTMITQPDVANRAPDMAMLGGNMAWNNPQDPASGYRPEYGGPPMGRGNRPMGNFLTQLGFGAPGGGGK